MGGIHVVVKNCIKEIMLKYPKMTYINRKDNILEFGLVYPYSYEYRDKIYNKSIFGKTGEIKFDTTNEMIDKEILKDLYKIKRFLKNYNENN